MTHMIQGWVEAWVSIKNGGPFAKIPIVIFTLLVSLLVASLWNYFGREQFSCSSYFKDFFNCIGSFVLQTLVTTLLLYVLAIGLLHLLSKSPKFKKAIDVEIPIRDGHLWIYALKVTEITEISQPNDEIETHFGYFFVAENRFGKLQITKAESFAKKKVANEISGDIERTTVWSSPFFESKKLIEESSNLLVIIFHCRLCRATETLKNAIKKMENVGALVDRLGSLKEGVSKLPENSLSKSLLTDIEEIGPALSDKVVPNEWYGIFELKQTGEKIALERGGNCALWKGRYNDYRHLKFGGNTIAFETELKSDDASMAIHLIQDNLETIETALKNMPVYGA